MNSEFLLSLNILLHDLKIPFESNSVLYDQPAFSGFELYDHHKNWKKSHLIVGMLSEILPIASLSPKITFLCIRDRFADDDESPRSKQNIIVLTTNRKLPSVFNEILSIYAKYQQWDLQMQLSVASNEGIQPLFDLSEHIIGNHMHAMDSTYKLLGYTRNHLPDDEITTYLIQNGYHSDETIRRFKELRRFEQYEKETDIIISDDYALCDHVTVKRVFHLNNTPSIHVIMHCDHREADDSLFDLFRLFLKYMEHYVKLDLLHPSSFSVSTGYLRDLFDGNITNADEAISRASYAAIPFREDYRLYAIAFADDLNAPLNKLATDINQSLPSSYALSYHRRIVVLQPENKTKKREEQILTILNQLLADYEYLVGASNPFTNLWESRVALEQAGCALEYGFHIDGSKDAAVHTDRVRFYAFEDALLTLLVAKSHNSSPDIFKNSFLFQSIRILEEYDRDHSSSLLRTAATYLDCNQKATETSERLHMHRNTVLYQIDRIEHLLGISLDDPDARTKLFLAIRTYQTNMIDQNV